MKDTKQKVAKRLSQALQKIIRKLIMYAYFNA